MGNVNEVASEETHSVNSANTMERPEPPKESESDIADLAISTVRLLELTWAFTDVHTF